MKKVTVIAIAVLFSLVGFKYANAQYTMGGKLTTINLDITYEQELPATSQLSQGEKLVTVEPDLFRIEVIDGDRTIKAYDPVVYSKFDTNNNVIETVFAWSSPNPSSPFYKERIYTISCSGGNQIIGGPPPDLPELLDGIMENTPQISLTKPPATYTVSFEGTAICYFCPDGFAFSSPGVATGLCNNVPNYTGGESYGKVYLISKGTAIVKTSTNLPISISVTGQLGGSGFYYDGADWASAACPTAGIKPCKAMFDGTFGATLTLCSDSICSTL